MNPFPQPKKAIDVDAWLARNAEPEYAAFAARLLPGTDGMLGVRLPRLRRLARTLAKEEGAAYLRRARNDSFEARMLQGMVIGCLDAPAREVLPLVAAFVPKIDNWSVCDSFCSGLKLARREPDAVWEFIQPYFGGAHPFAVRFALVMLLTYYIDAAHLPEALDRLAGVRHENYYVQMAVAWAASMYYVSFPEAVLAWLEAAPLDDFTYRKTVQKICESRQVPDSEKRRLRTMARLRRAP